MKVRWTRHCVALLLMSIPLHLMSCSSSSQQEDWEMSDEYDNFDENYNNYENYEDSDDYEDNYAEEGNYDNFSNYDDGAVENEYADYFSDENFGSENFSYDPGNSDLSNIMAEMDQNIGNEPIMGTDDMGVENMAVEGGYENYNAATGALTEVDQGIEPYAAEANFAAEQGMSQPMVQQPMSPVVSSSPGLPEYGSKMPYIVERGDTLAKIATRIYGNSTRWREIADLTSLHNPSRIYPGDVVYYQLTEESMAFATAYESLPRQEITVNHGDTLANIAARVFGDSTNWKAIWRQNDSISNPDRLEAGMVLHYIMPGALSAALDQGTQTVVAGVQEISVDSFEVVNVQVDEKNDTNTLNEVMALFNATLNFHAMA